MQNSVQIESVFMKSKLLKPEKKSKNTVADKTESHQVEIQRKAKNSQAWTEKIIFQSWKHRRCMSYEVADCPETKIADEKFLKSI